MARPTSEKKYLKDKRNELIWALDEQDYSDADIGIIFNVHRSTVGDVIKKKPRGWVPKWRKVR